MSPVARMARPSRVLRKSPSSTAIMITAAAATASLYCSLIFIFASAYLTIVNTVPALFMFSMLDPPIMAMFTEYSPVFTIMPASRLFTPILVCSMAVMKPEATPASMAAGMDKYGCPDMATAAPTTAPSVKQPSVERSHTLSIE